VRATAPARATALPAADLQPLPPEHPHLEVERLIREEAERLFDLARNPLLPALSLRESSQEHLQPLTAHRTVSDSRSVGIFFQELAALCKADRQSLPSPLPELPVQYAGTALWQRQWLAGEVRSSQLCYWKQQLSGNLPVLEKAGRLPATGSANIRGKGPIFAPAPESERGSQSAVAAGKSRPVCNSAGSLPNIALPADRARKYSRRLSQMPVATGPKSSRRSDIPNTPVFLTHLQNNPSAGAAGAAAPGCPRGLRSPRPTFREAGRGTADRRDLTRTPPFQVFFNPLNLEENRLVLTGVTAENLPHSELDSRFDLTLYAREKREGIHLEIVYSADLFDSQRMSHLLAQLHHLQSQIVKNPAETITPFSPVTPQTEAFLPNPAQPLSLEWFCPPHTRSRPVGQAGS
jgi:hypothetical protein